MLARVHPAFWFRGIHPDVLLWVTWEDGIGNDISSYHHALTATGTSGLISANRLRMFTNLNTGTTPVTVQTLYGPDVGFDYVAGDPFCFEGFFERITTANNTFPAPLITRQAAALTPLTREFFALYANAGAVQYETSGFGTEAGPAASAFSTTGMKHFVHQRPTGTGSQVERFWVNGVQVFTYTANRTTIATGAQQMIIGGPLSTNGGPQLFDGYMGEVRLSRRVLYNTTGASFTPPTTGNLPPVN